MSGTDLVGYVESIVGAKRSAGSEWVIDCPFCGKNGRLYINTEVGEGWDGRPKLAGRWICFSCGEKSMSFEKLLAELEGISFDAARNMMGHWKAGGYSWTRPQTLAVPADSPEQPGRASWLPVEFEPVSKVWPKYLDGRRIPRDIAAEFGLGVCRRHDRCHLCRPSGGCPMDMSHRVILPLDCPLGRDFQARAIPKGMEPRYLSGPDCGQLLFGWHTVETSDTCVIVEGPFDAIALRIAGYPSVAIMGKTLRDGQRELLLRRNRSYVVMLDPIAKDKDAVDKACEIAWLVGGQVGNNLMADIDPGDATGNQAIIDSWVQNAIAPREALSVAMTARISREFRR